MKETPDLIRSEHEFIKNEIHNLTPSEEGGNTVHHKLILTMVDGKVCQALTSTASSNCYLCQPVTKPSGMINLTVIKEKETSTEHLKFGLSPLHLLINTLECVLHIGYRMQVKTWCVKGEVAKNTVTKEKKRIQRELKETLGINVVVATQIMEIVQEGSLVSLQKLQQLQKWTNNLSIDCQ